MKTTPAPEKLYATLKMIEDVFKDCVCKKKKKPLFTSRAIIFWEKLLALALDGYIGDFPDMPQYIELQQCPITNLRTFMRTGGTSWLESWHLYQKQSVSEGLGDVVADLLLHMRVDRFNLNSAVKSRGLQGYGHAGV